MRVRRVRVMRVVVMSVVARQSSLSLSQLLLAAVRGQICLISSSDKLKFKSPAKILKIKKLKKH